MNMPFQGVHDITPPPSPHLPLTMGTPGARSQARTWKARREHRLAESPSARVQKQDQAHRQPLWLLASEHWPHLSSSSGQQQVEVKCERQHWWPHWCGRFKLLLNWGRCSLKIQFMQSSYSELNADAVQHDIANMIYWPTGTLYNGGQRWTWSGTLWCLTKQTLTNALLGKNLQWQPVLMKLAAQKQLCQPY